MVTRFAYHKINLLIPIALGTIGARGLIYFYRHNETTYALASLLVLAIAGLAMIEIVVSKVVLGEERMVIQRLLKCRILERAKIEEVAWAKGRPVTVRYEGRWIALPSLGKNKLSVTDSIRGWLKGHGETPNS